MYDAYFADQALVPPGQLVEIAYEDLERDPSASSGAIYDGLDLGDLGSALPAVEAYLASTADYRKNRNPAIDEATRRKVAGAWARCFDAWGLSALIASIAIPGISRKSTVQGENSDDNFAAGKEPKPCWPDWSNGSGPARRSPSASTGSPWPG